MARPRITFDFGGSPEARWSAAPASTSISTQALGMCQMRHCSPAAEARARLLGQSQAWTDSPYLFLCPPCPKSFCTPWSILLQGPAWTSRAPSTVRVKVLVLRHVQSAAMWCQQAVGLVLGGISQELSQEPFHTPPPRPEYGSQRNRRDGGIRGFRGQWVQPFSTNPWQPHGRLPVNCEDIVFSPRAPLICLLLKDLKYAPR